MKRRLINAALLLAFALFAVAGCQASTEKKPVPQNQNNTKATTFATLMEAAEKDTHPGGCVSCHKKEGDVDRTLSAYVKRIAGHPEVKANSVSDCYGCHEAQKDYARYTKFFRGLHRVHWKSDIFYAKVKGQCYSCHTVESNGVAGIKGYPLAGYRSAPSGTAGKTSPVQPESTKSQTKKSQTNKPETTTPEQKQGTTGQSQTPSGQAQPKGGLAVPQSNQVDELPTPTP